MKNAEFRMKNGGSATLFYTAFISAFLPRRHEARCRMGFDRKDATAQKYVSLRVFAPLRSTFAVVMLLTATVRASWPTYHGAPDLRGVATGALPEMPARIWRYDVGEPVDTTPVSDGTNLYFSARKGRVGALDLKGKLLWKKRFTRTNDVGQAMPVRMEAPLLCGNGLVLVGARRGTLYAVDAKSGAERWKYETGGTIVASPNWIDSKHLVVMDQSEGILHALNAHSGALLWRTEGVERCDGTPGVDENRIVFGSCQAAFHLCTAKGKRLKDIDVGGDGQIAGGVAVDGTHAFAGTREGCLVCVELATGEILWCTDAAEDEAFATPAVISNRVVYASGDGRVLAVDRETGDPVWSFETGGSPSSPVIAGDKVAVSSDGTLYLLSLKDGRTLWSKAVSDEITSPAVVGNRIVVGTDDGSVLAFGAGDRD